AIIIILNIGIISKNFILVAFSLGALSSNINGYFKSFFQAIGEFNAYGKALNIEKITLLVSNLFILFVLKSDNYKLYILTQVIVSILTMVYLGILLNQKIR